METTSGKLQLVIRSKKVLARVEEFEVSLRGWNGELHVTKKTAKVYDYVLDERQARALKEARELARRSGLVLEVTDLSRQSVFRRMLTSGLLTRGPEALPEARPSSGSRSTSAGAQEREDVSPQVSQP